MATIKLNDTQRILLNSAIDAKHVDRFLRPVKEMKGVTKALQGLLTRELVVTTRSDTEMLTADIEGIARSFLITNAGLAAMQVDPAEYGVDPALGKAKAGVMGKNYHDLYMAQGGGCADTIDMAMKDAFMTGSRTVQTKKGERSEPALNVEAMAKWGKEIGLWNPNWERLNPGMQRMNLTNRVRSVVNKGVKIKLKMLQGERKGKTIELQPRKAA